MENKNQKHKNQFLSKQTLGPFGWGMEKWEGTKIDFNQKKEKLVGVWKNERMVNKEMKEK